MVINMKITLFSVNASRTHTNLAIRCIATSLKRKGFAVSLVEVTEKDSRTEQLSALFKENADIYGFSTYIWNVTPHLILAKSLKKLLPTAKIVFGGPEAACQGEEWLFENSFIDHIIRGEGEEAFADLALGKTSAKIIDSGVYKDFENESIHYDENEAFSSNILYYESSRGCPYKCSYCLSSLHTSKGVRAKSVAKTLEDLKKFEELDGIKIIKFIDRTFNFNKRRAYEIWSALLDPQFTKNYHFEVCASLLDDKTVELLSKFPKGKIQLEIGLQSTNKRTLEAIRRNDDPEKTLATLEKLTTLGNIHIHADLIAGLPFEDIASFEASFNDLYGKCHMLQLGFLKILKGTPIEKELALYGYKYSSEPPYEVLENSFLSFDDIVTLKHIELVLERFSNSGRFEKSLKLCLRYTQPFSLFKRLYDYMGNPAALSQRQAYTKLFDFFCENLGGSDINSDNCYEAKTEIAKDFLMNEQGHLPKELSLATLSLTKEEKRAFFDSHPSFSAQSTEFYDLKEELFAVDRKRKIEISLRK